MSTLAMAVYNVKRYIEQVLLSALNQVFESVECLINNKKIIVRRLFKYMVERGKLVCIIKSGI